MCWSSRFCSKRCRGPGEYGFKIVNRKIILYNWDMNIAEDRQWESVDNLIQEVKCKLQGQEKLSRLFETCYANTLHTTVRELADGTTYVITGDIPAMWLRDSAAQMRPYLIPARKDKALTELIAGLVRRQFFYINIDPYANAFNESQSGACWDQNDLQQNDWLWERKYEVDSLCYPIQLAYLLWKNTGCTSQFNEDFQKGADRILQTFTCEQDHEKNSSYRFIRKNTVETDTLSRDGKGAEVKGGIGLTWSGFRPSDDACTYGYLIPSNMFATVALRYLEEIADKVYDDSRLKEKAALLRSQIEKGIEEYGIVETKEYGKIYAYEVDGFGRYNLMDDANIPSLLSMPYLGYQGDGKIMQNTRRFILSEANPYYYQGKYARGIGSPHTPVNHIWPLSLIMQGMTSADKKEKEDILRMLSETDAGTGLMHESVNVDNPAIYTREWFSWANALFCEWLLDLFLSF